MLPRRDGTLGVLIESGGEHPHGTLRTRSIGDPIDDDAEFVGAAVVEGALVLVYLHFR